MKLHEAKDAIAAAINDDETHAYWVGMLDSDRCELADTLLTGESTVDEIVCYLAIQAHTQEAD